MTFVGPHGWSHIGAEGWSHYHADGQRWAHPSGDPCQWGVPQPDLANDVMVQAMTTNSMERILWVDSGLSFASTWTPEQMVTDRADEWDGKVTSVGFVVHETDDRIVLGLSRDAETGMWSGCFLIYKPCILERTKLT